MKLSKDEILKEPAGERLDSWIAEYVMGWIRIPDGLSSNIHNPPYYKWITGDGNKKPNIEFSTNIEKAWMIVEKHPNYFALSRSSETGFMPAPIGNMLWRCRFYEPDYYEAYANSVPLAICRAAMLICYYYFESKNKVIGGDQL